MGRDKKTFPAGEVRCIARAMAEGDLSQRRAAKRLHVADTTMSQWLERIKEIHGLDLRTFEGVTQGLRFGKPLTRWELIRGMSAEELAEYWYDKQEAFCKDSERQCLTLALQGKIVHESQCVACVLQWKLWEAGAAKREERRRRREKEGHRDEPRADESAG